MSCWQCHTDTSVFVICKQGNLLSAFGLSTIVIDCYYFRHHARYIGYCPQFKYQIGETFGRTTSQLLTDKRIASSGRPVLSQIHPELPSLTAETQDQRRMLISKRAYNLGDQKLFEEMVPGYTGISSRFLNIT